MILKRITPIPNGIFKIGPCWVYDPLSPNATIAMFRPRLRDTYVTDMADGFISLLSFLQDNWFTSKRIGQEKKYPISS